MADPVDGKRDPFLLPAVDQSRKELRGGFGPWGSGRPPVEPRLFGDEARFRIQLFNRKPGDGFVFLGMRGQFGARNDILDIAKIAAAQILDALQHPIGAFTGAVGARDGGGERTHLGLVSLESRGRHPVFQQFRADHAGVDDGLPKMEPLWID